jgi:hypothetical protein
MQPLCPRVPHLRPVLPSLLSLVLLLGCSDTSSSSPVPVAPEALGTGAQPLTAIPDSAVAATLPDMAWAQSPAVRRTIYVRNQCPSGSTCSSDEATCGSTYATACTSLHLGLIRLVNLPASSAAGADEVLVEGSSLPYYANHSFYWDAFGSGSLAHPRIVRGVRNTSGLLPRIVVEPSLVPSDRRFSGYASGTDPGTGKGEPAAFSFTGSGYWLLDSLNIDCANTSNNEQPFSGVRAVSGTDKHGTVHRAHHVVFRRLDIRRCANSAVELSASDDILIEGSYFLDNQKKELKNNQWVRADSNGVSIYSGAQRILIRGNTATGNTGDGVQCQGRIAQTDPDVSKDPSHITIESNTFYGNDENAVDIKTCHRINVKGSNHFLDYLPSDNNGEDPNNTTQCSGAAVIFHEGATRILVEGARIENAGGGIAVGNERWEVTDVILRRNQIRDINQESKVMDSTGTRIYNCGDGIEINRGDRIDIYHNTLQNIERSGIRVGVQPDYPLAKNVRVWNNIISDAKGNAWFIKNSSGVRSDKIGGALEYRMENAPGLYSQANLIHRTGGAATFIKATLVGTSIDHQPLTLAQWRTQMTTTVEGQGHLDKAPSGTTPGTEEADPLFYASGAYTRPSSPARNRALVDSGNGGSNQRCASAPDKGASESDCQTEVCVGEPSTAAVSVGSHFAWLKQPGTCADDSFSAVAYGANGDVIAAGTTRSTVGAVNLGGTDALLKRHASNGADGWVTQFGSTGDDFLVGVATDTSGNIYVAGSTTGVVAGPAPGGDDFFLAKFTSGGTLIWAKQHGTRENDSIEAFALHGNRIYVVGSTRGDFANDTIAYETRQEFVAQYDLDGNELRVHQSRDDGWYGTWLSDVAVDSSGNVVAVGCGPSAMAGWGPRTVKFSGTDLSIVWQVNEEPPEPWCNYAVATDSQGHVLVASGMDRVDSGGNVSMPGYIYKRHRDTGATGGVGGGISLGISGRVNDFVVGPNDAVFVTGRFSNGGRHGTEDLFVARHDKNTAGNYAATWTTTAASSESCGSGDVGHGVAVDATGAAAVAGVTCGPIAGPGTHKGGFDPLLLKLTP